jgi:hypothetical protein
MKTKTAQILHHIMVHTTRADILDILDAVDAHSLASAQLGISAQCAAITKTHEACDAAIDNIGDYYQGELEKHIAQINEVKK